MVSEARKILYAEVLTASSGEVCPCNGEWEIIGSPGTTAIFSKGKVMPAYYGKRVVWVLVRRG